MLRLGKIAGYLILVNCFVFKLGLGIILSRELKNRYLIRINDGNTSSFPSFILNGAIPEANIFFFNESYDDRGLWRLLIQLQQKRRRVWINF